MCRSASAHAIVATRTLLQVQYQKVLRAHQRLAKKIVQEHTFQMKTVLAVCFDAFVRNLLQFRADMGITLHHEIKVRFQNSHDFNVLQSGTSCCAFTVAQETDLAEVLP